MKIPLNMDSISLARQFLSHSMEIHHFAGGTSDAYLDLWRTLWSVTTKVKQGDLCEETFWEHVQRLFHQEGLESGCTLEEIRKIYVLLFHELQGL